MSLKVELETWAAAVAAYDTENFEEALELFSRISDSSKILTNIGLIYATLGDHETAVEQFIGATQLDQYLAVAYFQCGVSNFLISRYELALKDFDDALQYLRGNQAINYEQLGLKFKLYTAEVLFNKGLCSIYLGRIGEGLADLEEARREKATEEHNVIDEAIRDQGEGYTVFSIPVGVLYRPPENKIKNAKQKDYMGKAKLVAADDPNEAYTTFTGVTRLRQGVTPQGVFLDDAPPVAELTRSATVPAPRVVADPIVPPLQRSKTTINVPSNARERIRGIGLDLAAPRAGNSDGAPTAPLSATKALSLRRQNSTPDISRANGPPRSQQGGGPERMTEFYDDYIDAYRETQPPMPKQPASAKISSAERSVANWARNNATPGNYPPSRAPSRNAPGSASLRRKHTRTRTAPSRGASGYEEEEGYASGDYDDGSVEYELSKIRVKVHYQDEIRGLALTSDVPFGDFMAKLSLKFSVPSSKLDVKFKDEDGGMVSLKDDSDYEMAMETVKETAKGKSEGKLEIWCADV